MEFQTINIFAIQVHWFNGDPKTRMTHIFVSTRIRVAEFWLKIHNSKIYKNSWN